jgi:hypothetical protein
MDTRNDVMIKPEEFELILLIPEEEEHSVRGLRFAETVAVMSIGVA